MICICASKARPIGGSIIKAYLAEPDQDQETGPKPNLFWEKLISPIN